MFVRNEGNIVFLCTKDLMMRRADNTLQAMMGCKRKSECSMIHVMLNSLVSVWNKVNRVHENKEVQIKIY